MSIKIALAGNPNCGKTTLFNELTGSNQYVGNWSGVTVEKKEGKLKSHDDITIEDLPGIYSLSPYTKEEVVTRDYLVNNKPDCILNIIDGTNIERNLYLTTQLKEIGIPMVVAINMIDIVEKNGDKIDLDTLSRSLHCPVMGISALKNIGISEAVNMAIKEANYKNDDDTIPHVFTGSIEHSIAHIEETIQDLVPEKYIRWYAIKIFERDKKAYNSLNISKDDAEHLENHIRECEEELSDKSVCIITKDRYNFISKLLDKSIIKATRKDVLTITDKIDRFLTHRFFAIPLFAIIMYIVYTIAMGPIGTFLTEWMQNTLIGDIISNNLRTFLISLNVSTAIQSLLIDGIINGVGTVISYVPQMILLFLFISILEDSGYMARVAFIFDRLFRKFGLSGKSFIPMIIGSGCGVPAIMSCRTIEEERDRRLTIMLCTFIPCTAKMEIILLISTIFFNGNSLVATSMYFIGIIVVIISGIILKKLKYFSKNPIPFVIELPSYHVPSIKGIYFLVKDRIKDFIVKAGTVIFIACIISWFLMNFDFRLHMVSIDKSILKFIGEKIAIFFAPLGFGNWQCAVASISATIAKEQAAATLSMIASQNVNTTLSFKESIQSLFNYNPISAMSFSIFNIFNVPCMVAIFTAFKEHNSKKWGLITLLFQLFVGYILAFLTYQIGSIIF